MAAEDDTLFARSLPNANLARLLGGGGVDVGVVDSEELLVIFGIRVKVRPFSLTAGSRDCVSWGSLCCGRRGAWFTSSNVFCWYNLGVPVAGVTDSELSDLVKEYLRGGMVGIVLAVAIAELLVGVALLDEINDCRLCVFSIESPFTPIPDVGVSTILPGTFGTGSVVGIFREVDSSDKVNRELSPRKRESRTLGFKVLVFGVEGDGTALAGLFPTNDKGRLALAISPCLSN